MAETEEKTPPDAAPADSLESNEDGIDALEPKTDDGVIDATSSNNTGAPGSSANNSGGIKGKLQKFNVYLLIFGFILVLAGGVLIVAYFQSKKASTVSTIKTQTLTQSALQQVAASDATVGSSQQILNVQSSAVFAGKVLIREDLEVAGSLRIGGTTALTNLAVSGTSQFGQVQISKDLAVTGDTGIQGSLTIAKTLQVNGGATFSGPISAPQITTSNLQLNSDLVLTKHLIIGGPTPARANGPALGNGGTSSVSGSDTSGTASINVGTGATAGCFITINFSSKFTDTPHVNITPVGADGGAIDYYVTRTSSSFSICDATAPPAGGSFAFDYFVVE